MTNPPQQPDREEQIRQILAYLEQHKDQYDLKALRKQLLDAGYPNAVVDEALRRLAGGGKDALLSGPRLAGCGLSLANFIVISLLGGLLGSLANNAYLILAAPLSVLGVELAISAATWGSERWKNLSRIMLWAVIWTLTIAAALAALGALLFGICLAIFSGQL